MARKGGAGTNIINTRRVCWEGERKTPLGCLTRARVDVSRRQQANLDNEVVVDRKEETENL